MLPIDPDEKVLAIYRHHFTAYLFPFLLGVVVVTILLGLAMLLTSSTKVSADPIIPNDYQDLVLAIAGLLSVAAVVFTFIPIWLRSQEHIVLTDEAILQVLQPALFATKVSQTSLERIADVSIHQDFLGTIFGYGTLVVETPGEQDNYDYRFLPHPRESAREIIEAHENFAAALESGQRPTTLGAKDPASMKDRAAEKQITLTPEEYKAFLKYQSEQSKTDTQN